MIALSGIDGRLNTKFKGDPRYMAPTAYFVPGINSRVILLYRRDSYRRPAESGKGLHVGPHPIRTAAMPPAACEVFRPIQFICSQHRAVVPAKLAIPGDIR